MASASGPLFASPRPSPKVHDCRLTNPASANALASLGSPTQHRGAQHQQILSPTNKRTARTRSAALPFGFPAFGFPAFGFPAGPGQTGKHAADNAHAMASGSPSSGSASSGACSSAAGASDAAAGSAGISPSGTPIASGPHSVSSHLAGFGAQLGLAGVRRRLNLLPPLTAHPHATTPEVAPLGSDPDQDPRPRGPEQEQDPDGQTPPAVSSAEDSPAGKARRRSPLPLPWQQEEQLKEDQAGEWAAGEASDWQLGAAAGYGNGRGELELHQLPQLLADVYCGAEGCSTGPAPHDLPAAFQSPQLTHHHYSYPPAPAPAAGSATVNPATAAPQQSTRQQLQQQLAQRRQALLDQLHAGLAGGSLRPSELLKVPGLLPFLVATMEPHGAGGDGLAGDPQVPTGGGGAAGNAAGGGGAAAGTMSPDLRWRLLVPRGPQERSASAGSGGSITAATGVALECLCTLLSEESIPPRAVRELLPAVRATLDVLRAARLPGPASGPPTFPSYAARAAVMPYDSIDFAVAAATETSLSQSPGTWLYPAVGGGGSAATAGTATAAAPADGSTAGAGFGWSADVSAAFFAASVLVRAARYPTLAEEAVMGGALELLVRLMGCRPAMLSQMAVFAVYKLVRPLPPQQTAQPQPSPPQSAPFGASRFLHSHKAFQQQQQQQQRTQPLPQGHHGGEGEGEAEGLGRVGAECGEGDEEAADAQVRAAEEQRRRQRQRLRDTALLAVAQAGGMRALCGCLESLDDRPSRDMASALMLDMALVPQVPSVVARLNQVGPLVAVMGSRHCDHIARMYALLVLARLCNHSPECQMDAVREGAVEPLLALVRRGCDEERTHACRLLAILAQAVPTHGRFKEFMVVQCVTPLLRQCDRSPVVAEHASSVLAVLAQNPDMHFHMVGCGAVPAMVPLLAAGTEKARTYALATLMLLCEQEERHAAVVVRAGALPSLVAMASGGRVAAATAPLSGPAHHHHSPPTTNRMLAAAAAAAAAVAGLGASPASGLANSPGAGSSSAGASASASGGSMRGTSTVQEFAAAVLCSLSRYVDVQAELVANGALPALVRCLGHGAPEAAAHAAEALVHVAAGDSAAKREVAGDTAAARALISLLSYNKPSARYWALQLLRALSTDDTALRLVAGLGRGERLGALAELERIELLGRLRPSMDMGDEEEAEEGATGVPPAHQADSEEAGASAAAAPLVGALVRLLRWSDGEAPSWQQGRCRVLAAWLLARMCGMMPFAPLVVASGAVRELLGMLAEEQRRLAAMDAAAAAAAAAAASGSVQSLELPPDVPGSASGSEPYNGDERSPSGNSDTDGEGSSAGGKSSLGEDFPDVVGAGRGAGGGMGGVGGRGSGGGGAALPYYPRRTRFDVNAAAASTAALLAVARLGQEGRMAVLAELAFMHWVGTRVQLEGLPSSSSSPSP